MTNFVLLPDSTTVNNNIVPPCGSGSIRAFPEQTGAPRGGGWGTGTTYSYFLINCTGNDTAGSAAIARAREDIMRLLPTE
jgi:hypothetical protein